MKGRYKPVGWILESQRHSLARRGIKTNVPVNNYKIVGATGKKPLFNIPDGLYASSDNFSMQYEDGKLKLSLGNMSTAGWYWDGNEKDLILFLTRIGDSREKDKFLYEMKKNNIKFSDLKEQMLHNIEKDDDGIYALSGDNSRWKFGNDEPYIDDEISDLELQEDKKKEFEDKFWRNYEGVDYDGFYKENKKELKAIVKKMINESDSFEDYFEAQNDSVSDFEELYDNSRFEKVSQAMGKTRKELGV